MAAAKLAKVDECLAQSRWPGLFYKQKEREMTIQY
jgi:hypothetical protein